MLEKTPEMSQKCVQNPFASPPESISTTSRSLKSTADASSFMFQGQIEPLRQRKFKSARLVGEYSKPWTEKKDKRMIWDKVFVYGLAMVGVGIGAYIVYNGWSTIENPPYCMVFEDDFSNGINTNSWNFEQQVGGFGVGSFDWTTNDTKNAYTDASGLHIVPTITTDVTSLSSDQLLNGFTLNLTSSGICTGTGNSSCTATSNSTAMTMINPVRSARLTTQGKHTIRYGKVEVVAKLPAGNWLWPAIWMMPDTNTYGIWPASGEIDIMESKGNNGQTYTGGRNTITSALHWAPQSILDAFWRTKGANYLKRSDYASGYHTYGMEWSANYIYTYVDSRLAQTMYIPFSKKLGGLYERGDFGDSNVNGTVPEDPWGSTGRYNTPFDQPFFLILNVAVGSSNGFFQDGYGGKPWIDSSGSAMLQFWKARDSWEPTWGAGDARGMTVKSVKMWQRGDCGNPAPQ